MGNAYSALALFALGLSLASLPAPSSENDTNSTSSMSITPSTSAAQTSSMTTRKIIPFSVAELRLVSFLVGMKSFLVPFICMQACFIFSGDPDLGVAAFMYGVLPTAPSVSLFASIYRIGNDVKIIPAATLAGTCAVPPLVYLGARLLMIATSSKSDMEFYNSIIDESIAVLGFIGAVMATWTLLAFVFTRMFTRSMMKRRL